MNIIETMKQAREAIEDLGMKHFEETGEVLYKDVYDNLRAAIDAAEKQEPVDSWSLESDYFFYTAEKHKADLSMCDEGVQGAIWFNGDDFLRFCKEIHNPAPTQPDSEQAKDAARYRKERDELLEAMEGEADAVQFLMDWCVKNINKWDFPQYDNLCYWIEKRKAAIAKVGAGRTGEK